MISTTINRVLYSGDGNTSQFAFPYAYLSQSDLVVYLKDATGSEAVQTLTNQYVCTPSAGASDGGTITMLTAPPASTTLLIYRDKSQVQSLDLVNRGQFSSENVETAFDKLTMFVQRLQEQADRSLKLKRTDSSVTQEIPFLADRTGTLAGWDASGRLQAVAYSSVHTGTIPVTTFWTNTLANTSNASNSLVALGVSAWMVGNLLDDTGASPALVTLGLSPFMIGSFIGATTITSARAALEVYPASPMMFVNGRIHASISSSAITFSLLTGSGASPSSSNPVFVSFPNSSIANASWSVLTVTTQPTLTIDWSSTLGLGATVTEQIHIFGIDNAGTLELAAMGGANVVGPYQHVTTTAVGSTGLADSRYTLYSTTARTGVRARHLQAYDSTQTNAGDWNTSPTKAITDPVNSRPAIRSQFVLTTCATGTAAHGTGATTTIRYSAVESSVSTAMSLQSDSTVGTVVTILDEGLYYGAITHKDATASYFGISKNQATLTDGIIAIPEAQRLTLADNPTNAYGHCSFVERLVPGDKIRPVSGEGRTQPGALGKFRIFKIGD